MNDRIDLSVADLLRRLELEGHLDAAQIGRVVAHLRDVDAEASSPWYLKAMMGIGGWVAGVFFLSFVACAGLVGESRTAMLAWGLVLLVAALAIHRIAGRLEFAGQLALALSVAAHGLLVYVSVDAAPGSRAAQSGAAALTGLALCLSLYPVYRDAVHRFLSCALLIGLVISWLVSADLHHGLHAVVAAQIAGLCAVFTSRRIRRSRYAQGLLPLGYALAVSLLLVLLGTILAAWEVETPLWPSGAILAASLVYVIGWAGEWGGWLRTEAAWWAIGVAVLLGAISTPGLLAALVLLVLGYAGENHVLRGLGVVFLPIFVVALYYSLEVDLLTKSVILVASGAVLLGARHLAGKRPWALAEEA